MIPHHTRTLDGRLLDLQVVLGLAMRDMRLEAGLTLVEMARRTGTHRPICGRIEHGRHLPRLVTLKRWAWACDRNLGELMIVVDRWLGLVPMTMPVLDRVGAKGKHRGHPMYYDESADLWRYEDDNSAVKDHWKARPCGHCNVGFTSDGHDPCIAALPGVRNACCGHGVDGDAYVQFDNGGYKSGAEAVLVFDQLRTAGADS